MTVPLFISVAAVLWLFRVVDGVVVIDANGTILSFNPAAEKIFGRPGDSVLNASISELFLPRDLKRFLANLARPIKD